MVFLSKEMVKAHERECNICQLEMAAKSQKKQPKEVLAQANWASPESIFLIKTRGPILKLVLAESSLSLQGHWPVINAPPGLTVLLKVH